jgi:hypothetical protein
MSPQTCEVTESPNLVAAVFPSPLHPQGPSGPGLDLPMPTPAEGFGPQSIRFAGMRVAPARPATVYASSAATQLQPASRQHPEARDSGRGNAGRPHLVRETNRHTELRRCEDLFFAFDFPELVRRCGSVIEKNNVFGDAYAFRCFALLAEIQQGMVGEEEVDLVDLLRDYFSACERPVATEGATVCRLFLKLVFGDLVKKIARADHGTRFTLEKSDPVCGGAFAVLNGDFGTALRRFDAGIADPASKAYALAGIGLLKAFNSDIPGAISAFASAGGGDEDILALSGLLKY